MKADLSDPATCGEDLPDILRWLLDHADEACDGCAYYHVGFLAQRFTPGGVAVVNGRIVENLHVETAKRLLVEAQAIESLEAQTATVQK